jgi:transcriptional regulator with XRE-family HTH domain
MGALSRQERLAAAIKASMDAAGFTPDTLAPIVSASARTIHRWRNGTGTPDALQIRPMADALGVKPSLFVDPPVLPEYPLDDYRLTDEEAVSAATRLAHLDSGEVELADPPDGRSPAAPPRTRPRRAAPQCPPG